LEVAVAVVGNRWPDLPGNLLGFRAWLQPSETKEMSIINHIALLPFSEDIPTHFRCKDIEQNDRTHGLDYNIDTVILNIVHQGDPYTGHLYYNKWHKI
jgi:hypothetical protein